jgi:hypothetical protein
MTVKLKFLCLGHIWPSGRLKLNDITLYAGVTRMELSKLLIFAWSEFLKLLYLQLIMARCGCLLTNYNQ